MIPFAYRLRDWNNPEAKALRQSQQDFAKICKTGQKFAKAIDKSSHATKMILLGENIVQPFKECSKNIKEFLEAIYRLPDDATKLDRISEAIHKGNLFLDKEKGPWG